MKEEGETSQLKESHTVRKYNFSKQVHGAGLMNKYKCLQALRCPQTMGTTCADGFANLGAGLNSGFTAGCVYTWFVRQEVLMQHYPLSTCLPIPIVWLQSGAVTFTGEVW